MRRSAKDKERHRFYLLPGMGGKALRRKRKAVLKWTIAAGLFFSVLVACLLYVLNRMHQP